MERIYFFLSKNDNIITNIIKWYQFGDSHIHCGFVISTNIPENPIVIEALDTVRQHRWVDAHNSNETFDLFYVEVTEEQKDKFNDIMRYFINKKYDTRGIFSFLFRKNISDKNKYFCSEFVYEVFWRLGIELLNNTASWEVYPSMLKKSHLVHKV